MTSRVIAALKVVQLVAERPDATAPASVGGIAAELGMSLSSASRLCSELETIGLLERGTGYGAYRLGRVAIRLSGRAAAAMAPTLRFALTFAAQRTGETVCLAARSSSSMRIVGRVSSAWTLHSPAELGEPIDDERSAIGRAASLRDDEAAAAPPQVETTIGMSVEIATPVLGPGGERVAVLAVRLPANRIELNGPRARRAVAVARRTIETALGEWMTTRRAGDAAGVADPASAVPASAVLADPAAAPAAPSALEAALRILEHLSDGPDTLAGTARATGLRHDRAQRLIESCQRAGLVQQTADRSQFFLGWIVHGWYRAASVPILVAGGKPLVAESANRLRLCGFITVLTGMRSFTVVEELEMAGEGLEMSPWLGRAHPIIGSDGGPTLLMDFDEGQLTQLFPARHTPQELAKFAQRARRVGRDGVLSMQAFEDAGLVSISAPVRDSSGIVAAAACLVGTTDHVRAHQRELERETRELADRVSALLV